MNTKTAPRPLPLAVEAVPPHRALVTRPEAKRSPEVPKLRPVPDLDRYAESLKQAGIECDELPELLFQRFLAESGLPLYEYREVCAAMDALVRELPYDAEWFWQALREKDCKGPRLEGHKPKASNGGSGKAGYTVHHGRYRPTLPQAIVDRIIFVEENFKAYPVYFFVADYRSLPGELPDPWLLAGVDGGAPHVIGWWPEPGWGRPIDQLPARAAPAARRGFLGFTFVEWLIAAAVLLAAWACR
jgi:hypothetical protein